MDHGDENGVGRPGKGYLNLAIAVAAAGLGGLYVFGITRIVMPPYGDPIGPRAFPILIAIGFFIAAILAVIEYLRVRRSGTATAEWTPLSFPVIAVVAWTAAYLVVFEWLGYMVATTIYVIPLMMHFNPGRWIMNVVVSVAFCVVSYVGLAVMLDAQLPRGRLFQGFLE